MSSDGLALLSNKEWRQPPSLPALLLRWGGVRIFFCAEASTRQSNFKGAALG